MMRDAARKLLVATAAATALAGALPARGEAPTRPPKKPYEHYKLIETRNIFAPPAQVSAAAAAAQAAVAPGARMPVLTGIVLDARTGAYKGLIETPVEDEPRFFGAGDTTVLGPVARVTLDRIVIKGEEKEIAVPLGSTITPDGVIAAPSGGAAVPDPAAHQDVLERLKSRYGRTVEKPPAAPSAPAEPPTAGISEKHRSILEILKERRRRSSGGNR
jgi:hypothetical protein